MSFRAWKDRADRWPEEARARLRELIGLSAAPERVEPRLSLGTKTQRPGYTRTPITFETRPHLSACGYLLIPDALKPPAPAVICIPGHGRGADEIVGITETGGERDDLDGYQHDFAVQSVRAGYVTLALEPLGFGRRRDAAARKSGPGASSCQPAAGAALLLGETMVGWRVWDALRAVDVLSALPEVDSKRVAMMGISGGGTVILYAAALDERVKVAVLSGSFCTFKDSIFSRAHCIDNYVPGLLRWFEAHDIAGLIAPRFLFVENGTLDEIFPEPGVRQAFDEAREVFNARGAAAHAALEVFEGGHSFHGKGAFQKLGEWL